MPARTSRALSALAAAATAVSLLGASCAHEPDPAPPTTAPSSVADPRPAASTTATQTPAATQAPTTQALAGNIATTTAAATTTQEPAATEAPTVSAAPTTSEAPPATTGGTATGPSALDVEHEALVDAFLGVGAVRDLCPIWSSQGQPITAGDYSEYWYAWEHCVLHGYGSHRHTDPAQHQIPEATAREIVAEMWADYGPWMARAYFASVEASSSVRGWDAPVVAVGDWTPGMPSLHFDLVQFENICATEGFEDTAACHFYGEIGSITATWSAEKAAYEVTLTRTEPNQIFLKAPNVYLVLHELAHAVDSNRWRLFGSDEPAGAAAIKNERTSGHGLSLRCLALDLYRRYTDAVDQIAYEVLNGLCRLHAPGYPTISEP